MKRLIRFWTRHISPYLASLMAALGTVGLAVCMVILLGLSKLFQEVWEKEAFSLDTTLLLQIHHWANPVLDRVMLGLTQLGNPGFIVGVVIGSLSWLWWKQKRTAAQLFAIACLGALALNTGLKLFFAKPRPTLWAYLITEKTFSFPSGHALGSMVIYGFLAYLLASYLPRFSLLIYTATGGLIAAIGLSRLYLGVHWPSDVLAGYAVGFLWLITCITLLKLQAQDR
ncbi:MAG: phosphatase PAP2 family protein [Gloeobacterales cyanobacterium]